MYVYIYIYILAVKGNPKNNKMHNQETKKHPATKNRRRHPEAQKAILVWEMPVHPE